MKKTLLFLVMYIVGGLFSVNALDTIVLKDGNIIEAKIMEIYPGEIRYKRADNLNGPMVILSKDRVLSIKYESGVVEIVNVPSSAGQESGAGSSSVQQLGAPSPLQVILNTLPAIRIAGNNLKFQFGGDNWTASVNGENYFAGTIEIEDNDGSSILNLKQTHIWPGAAGKAMGMVASKVGGGAVGGALSAAGSLAGSAGPVEASGPVFVLEYKAGPPPRLAYLRSTTAGALALSADPMNIVLSDAEWVQYAFAETAAQRNDTTVNFSIANEIIGGEEREVLTLETNLAKGSGWGYGKYGKITLTNITMVQTLQQGSGIRFKALGDGKRWKVQLGMHETMSDACFHEIPIVTKDGKVVEVDVPFSKLKQPSWGKKVPFKNSSINALIFIKDGTLGVGPSTVKIFDLMIY